MKVVVRILVVLLLLAGGAAGVWYWQRSAEAGDQNILLLFGNIDVRQVELAFDGNDRIAELLVEEGDRVERGALMGKLDTSRLELLVERARAAMETQAQVVARLMAGSRPEEIHRARADLEAAKAVAVEAGRTYERNRELLKSRAVSIQDVEDSKAAYDAARAKVKAAEAALELAIKGPREEDKNEAKALLKRFEVELKLAEHDLKDAYLYAPSECVVQNRILEVGDMASPVKPVFTVALVDPVWVRAYVSEPDLGKIYEGMEAKVVTDSFPDKEYDGWIGFISPTAEFTPKPVETRELRTRLVYQVRVLVKNPRNELRLGMPATVRLDLSQPKRPSRAATDSPKVESSGNTK